MSPITYQTPEAHATVTSTHSGYVVQFGYPAGVTHTPKPPRTYIKRGTAIRVAREWVS